MDYQPLSKDYLGALHRIADSLVEICNLPEEGKGITIPSPRGDGELSHYGTLRTLVTTFAHYLQRGTSEARRHNDEETVQRLHEEFKRMIEAEASIPSNVVLET